MNNEFENNLFTWSVNKQPSLGNVPATDDHNALSDSDLFQMLLGEEAKKAIDQTPPNQPEPSNESNLKPYTPSKKEKPNPHPYLQQTTSRLDFRPINDPVSDSQLKVMTSKERRQLRNKISARNFRNRRKEYITTLEEELDQHKAENSQLKLELKWAQSQMDKLQKENDSLRLDLVLSGMGIPSQTQAPVDLTTTLTPVPAEELLPLPSSGSNTNTSSSSDSSFTSSPPNLLNEFPDNWDFALADFSDSTLLNNQQDTYLSHALVPTWNLNQVLSKEQAQTSLVPSNHNQLFYQYPLLAPALMSVVLSHTMTMSTNELLASARLSPLNNGTMGTFFSEKNPLESSTTLNEKDAKAVWDILEPLTLLKERNEKFAKETKNSMVTQHVTNTDEITGLAYLQQSLCRYLCEFIASNCVTKVCKEKTTLCKRFKQAKRYITACE